MDRFLISVLVWAAILLTAALAEEPQPQTSGQAIVEMARSAARPGVDRKRVLAREEMDQVTAGQAGLSGLDILNGLPGVDGLEGLPRASGPGLPATGSEPGNNSLP